MNGQNTGWRPPRRFSVTVQHLARPPMPWTWVIHEDDVAEPLHRSCRFYRSAEEAWAVGRAMLARMTGPIHGARTQENRSEASGGGPNPN
jgi:hypothetical protein